MKRIGDGPLQRVLESFGPDPRIDAIIRGLREDRSPEEIRADVLRINREVRKAA